MLMPVDRLDPDHTKNREVATGTWIGGSRRTVAHPSPTVRAAAVRGQVLLASEGFLDEPGLG